MTGAVFIDLSKAFDTLGHSSLLSKLESYGIDKTPLAWFTDYLFGRFQVVSFDNELSEKYVVNCGVPQGSILGPILFLIQFNDFVEVLQHCEVVKFADGTVVYLSGNDVTEIERKLNLDLKNVSEYFTNNELVINLKQSKTESMLFGTSKRLSKSRKKLELWYQSTPIHAVSSYKYLGTTLDPTLSLVTQFNNMYKKASSKLKLLSKLKFYLTYEATKRVYQSIILPGIKYNCIANLNFSQSQKNKLKSLDNRALNIVGRNANICTIDVINKHAVTLVRKCIDKEVCSNFHNHFEMNNHNKATINRTYLLKVPKIKLEFARNSFYFMGVQLYNSLPIEIRQTPTNFKTKLKEFSFN